MIQDIFPMQMNNQYEDKIIKESDRVIVFRDQSIFLKYEENIEFLTYEQYVKAAGTKEISCRYLFSIEDEAYFLAEPDETFQVPGFSFHRMFEIRSMRSKECVFAAATAWHLYVWYRDNRFCGRCGRRLIHSQKLRMLECESCKNVVFPKIAPAVIVGVTNKDKILMTKYAGREYKRYALIAGFTEIGETAEETVSREVMEEVGLHVKNIHYYKSQPWGFDSNLLLGYFCELDDDEGKIKLDETELSVAEWVDYRNIPDDPEGLSLTREMMLFFREKKREEHKEV